MINEHVLKKVDYMQWHLKFIFYVDYLVFMHFNLKFIFNSLSKARLRALYWS